MESDMAAANVLACGLQSERASVRHGVAGIHDQIHDDLLDIRFVGENAGKVIGQRATKIDVLSNEAPEHIAQTFHSLIQIEDFRLDDLLPTKREKLPRKCACFFRGGGNLTEGLGDTAVEGSGSKLQARMALDDGENVIEVVRDAGSKLAHRLELMGVPELFFQLPLLADVDGGKQANGLRAEIKSFRGEEALARISVARLEGALEIAHGIAEPHLHEQELVFVRFRIEGRLRGRTTDELHAVTAEQFRERTHSHPARARSAAIGSASEWGMPERLWQSALPKR